MKQYIYLFAGVTIFSLVACKQNENHTDLGRNTSEISSDSLEFEATRYGHSHNVGRAIWQKPGLVIDKLGDLSQKTIADIGAGTGYFSYRLAKKAKKVIAIDIEPGMLQYIDSMGQYLNLQPNHLLETRLASKADPNLAEDESDIVLIINTIAYIPELKSYLKTLKKGLKPNGTLMIIDYKMKRLPINAPPKSERIYLDKLEELLLEEGYNVVETDDTSLDYQYIIQAKNMETTIQ